MSFFHKKNVTKFMGHHYAIWASDSNILLTQKLFSGTDKERQYSIIIITVIIN